MNADQIKAMMAGLPPGTPRIPQARPINLDPPEHSLYRRAISPLLTEERVARLEPRVREIVVGLLQPLVALVDRQHPHDLFMELSARVDFNVGENASLFLYGGPVGEPALGPSAFMHRGSARYNPEAPITHHWFDSTHITYGVVTAGYAARTWQIEASAFSGQEPDEHRWNIETPRLDSWSVRATCGVKTSA